MRSLLKCSEVDPNLPHSDGSTALYAASNQGHADCVAALLEDPEKRINLNVPCRNGRTAMYTAANQGNEQCVMLMIADSRVDVNQGWDFYF